MTAAKNNSELVERSRFRLGDFSGEANQKSYPQLYSPRIVLKYNQGDAEFFTRYLASI